MTQFEGTRLVSTLVRDLKPVKRLMDPMVFASIWLVVSVVICVGGLYVLFPLPVNWTWTFARSDVVIELGLLFVVSFLLAMMGLIMVRPGFEIPSWMRMLALILVGTFAVNFGLRWLTWGISVEMVQRIGSQWGDLVKRPGEVHRPACYLEVICWGLILFVGILYYINRGFAGPRRFLAAFFGAVAAGLLPAMLMHVFCTSEPAHAFKYHLLPILLNLLIVWVWMKAEDRFIRSRRVPGSRD